MKASQSKSPSWRSSLCDDGVTPEDRSVLRNASNGAKYRFDADVLIFHKDVRL